MKKWLMWYLMLSKRLFVRGGFLALLLLIPLLVPAANFAMQGESGVLNVALVNCSEDSRAVNVIEKLKKDDSVIRYMVLPTEEDGIRAVEQGKADTAWVFGEGYADAQTAYAKGKSLTPFVTVYQKDETVPLQLASEKLFAAVYPDFAYDVLEGFVEEKVDPNGVETDKKTKDIFEHTVRNRELVAMKKLNSDEKVTVGNILLTPLRGLISIVCVLCGLAAAMFLLWDIKAGRFDWMPEEKRILPLIFSVFAALVPTGIVAVLALVVSGAGTGWGEILMLPVFILCAAGFCLCVATVLPSAEKLGAAIPGISVALLALSPIFFNIQILKPLRLMFPVHYYLQALYDKTYLMYGLLYAVCAFLLAMGVYGAKKRFKRK